MALFGKDRERSDRGRGFGPDIVPATVALGEVEMFEREREKIRTHADDTPEANAFLGRGSKVTGKLVFEGPVRIEGHVEGEIAAQDTLTIGEGAVINAQIT